MTVRIDCRRIAETYLDWVRERLDGIDSPPGLAAVLVPRRCDPGSLKYRDLILKDAQRLGIRTRAVEAEDREDLVGKIRGLNADPDVQGIVVFYPLGLDMPDEEIMDFVSPEKDIEGLHSINLGYLIKYRRFLDPEHRFKCVVPATAKAVVKTLLNHEAVRIEGAFVTIVNNSMRVGKPLGLMLENLGATVVKCYDKTPRPELEACVRRSDILITAVPSAGFRIPPEWVKDAAAVLDVSFEGNIDVEPLMGRASFVSDPKNRIGRMTRAMMLVNLVYCARPELAGARP